jgi:hypothetical protein
MKTIRQIADEIGVSKQAIQKRIIREPLCSFMRPYIQIIGNAKYIDETGEKHIKSLYSGIDKSDLSIDKGIDKSTTKDNYIHVLIDTLQKQLEVKDNQIKELTEALIREQQLHAGTIQKSLTDGHSRSVGWLSKIFSKKQ